MWEYIRVLKVKKVKEKCSLTLYGENGVELEKGERRGMVKEFWGRLYRKYDDDIDTIWNADMVKYTKEYKKVKQDKERKAAVRMEGVEGMVEEYIET